MSVGRSGKFLLALATSVVLRSSIQFSTEIWSDKAIPFLDILVVRKGTTLVTKGYREFTHTGPYLSFFPLGEQCSFFISPSVVCR